jgi:putative colanic acid biosysnthesis UDP-glucose lipid carrier transferase
MTNNSATFFGLLGKITDYFLLNLVFLLCLEFSSSESLEQLFRAAGFTPFLLILINLLWYFCSDLVGVYQNSLKQEARSLILVTLKASILMLLALLVITLMLPSFGVSLEFLALTWGFVSFSLLCSKAVFLFYRKLNRTFFGAPRKVLVIGSGKAAFRVFQQLEAGLQPGYKMEGLFADQVSGSHPAYKGKVAESIAFARAAGVYEIYCALPIHQKDRIKALMREAEHHMIRFRLVPETYGVLEPQAEIERFGKISVFSPHSSTTLSI